jgi:hypothetical protein
MGERDLASAIQSTIDAHNRIALVLAIGGVVALVAGIITYCFARGHASDRSSATLEIFQVAKLHLAPRSVGAVVAMTSFVWALFSWLSLPTMTSGKDHLKIAGYIVPIRDDRLSGAAGLSIAAFKFEAKADPGVISNHDRLTALFISSAHDWSVAGATDGKSRYRIDPSSVRAFASADGTERIAAKVDTPTGSGELWFGVAQRGDKIIFDPVHLAAEFNRANNSSLK